MKKHIRVLEEHVTGWIDAYRRTLEERFDRLGELLENRKEIGDDR